MKTLMCVCLALAGNVAAAQSLLREAGRGRVDIVMLGDSNQLHSGHGAEEAWARALSSRYGLYGTGLHWLGENRGQGAQVGFACNTIANSSAGVFGYDISPSPPDPLNPAGTDLQPCSVAILQTGFTLAQVGMSLHGSGPYFEPGDELEFRAHFRTLGAGASLSPLLRLGAAPYTVFVQSPVIGHTPGVREVVLRHTPSTGDPLDFKLGNVTSSPYEAYFAHAVNLDRTTGAAVSTLYGNGGRSSRDAAGSIAALSDEFLTTYFATLRARQQSPTPRVFVRMAFGLNDRIEGDPSIRAGHPGNSPAAYVDNVGFIIDRVESIFVANGWSLDGLEFLVTLPHPVSEPNDAQLTSYEVAARSLDALPRVSTMILSSLITEPEMVALGYYIASFDHNHLSRTGYEALAALELGVLLDRTCPSDFNADGAVDGDDVIAFIGEWDMGLPGGDHNGDGMVDGDDVIVFFERWDAGC